MSIPRDGKRTEKVEHPQYRKIVFKSQTSALLVIDMQQYFCNSSSHAYFKDSTTIIPNIHQLITTYRQLSLPVLFTRYALHRTESPGAMGRWWNDVLYDDNKMSFIIDALHPLPQESVIRKTQYSAFFETDLDKILKNHQVTTIVITGVLTHLCCETTARDAFMRNYDIFFVSDATASDTKTLHSASLATLSDGFATISTTNEVCAWINAMK
ncbi:MAG TPA: isochorismatase family cysteine hydrolase [Candidatus Thermoplasmatota archaeon]|nr:isochorismatase family cysteine hydrolase [Candidatus Thermoplasmatota archaeon]